MKKLAFLFIGLILFLVACSSNTTTIKINGLTSDIKELNDKYINKTDHDYFTTVIIYSNDNGNIIYLIDDGFLSEIQLLVKDDSNKRTVIPNNYNIKTKDSFIQPTELEEKDILICYSIEMLETFPGRLIVDDLYYLNTKTDKDLSAARLAERV